MPGSDSLDDILAKLNIKVTSVKPSPLFDGGSGANTPRPALADSFSTPNRPKSSIISAFHNHKAEARIAVKPLPSLLDQYMVISPATEVKTSTRGFTNERNPILDGYYSQGSSLKEIKEFKYGISLQSCSTLHSSNSFFGSSKHTKPPKPSSAKSNYWTASLEADRPYQNDEEKFSISAVHSAVPSALDDGVSMSLCLSKLPPGRGCQPLSRLKPEVSQLQRGPDVRKSLSSWQTGLQTPGQPMLSRDNSKGEVRQPKSSLDDLQSLMLPREVSSAEEHFDRRRFEASVSSSNMEASILQSRVSELQAQLRLKEIENQKFCCQVSEAQQERDALQEGAQRWRLQVEALERQLKQAETQMQEHQQEVGQLKADFQSRAAKDSEHDTIASQLRAELASERSNSDALRQKVQQLEAAVEQELQQLRMAEQYAGRVASGGMQALRKSVGELSAENERLQKQLSKIQVERLVLRKQGEMHGEQLREAEARCRQLELDMHAVQRQGLEKDGALEEAQQQVSSLQHQVTRLTEQLATATEQCQQSQRALLDEQQGSQQQRLHASASQESETALTTQVKSMASLIQRLQQEAASLRAEKVELQQRLVAGNSAMQDELAGAERHAAALQVENAELQAQIRQAGNELRAKVGQMEEQRSAIKQVQARNASLQDKVHRYEEDIGQYAQQVGRLREQSAALHEELRGAKGRVAELEGAVVRSSSGAGGRQPGSSPLRDVVGSIRGELQEKDLQLVQLSEDLAAERRRGQDLQRQMLDQAMELDELQRQQSEVSSLRQQLAAAHATEAQLKKHVGELSQQLGRQQAGEVGCMLPTATPRAGTPRGNSLPCGAGTPAVSTVQSCSGLDKGWADGEEAAALRQELVRLQQERDRLQAECERRDAEVMHLQGQVRILQSQTTDAENWLMAL